MRMCMRCMRMCMRVRACVCVCCVRVRARVRVCVHASRRQGLIVEIYSNNISLLQARACLPACVRMCACVWARVRARPRAAAGDGRSALDSLAVLCSAFAAAVARERRADFAIDNQPQARATVGAP